MTGLLLHEPFDITTNEIAVGFSVAALQVRNDTLERRLKTTAHTQANAKRFLARAVENQLELIGGKFAGRHLQTKTIAIGDGLQLLHVPVIDIYPVVRPDSAFGYGESTVWNNQLRVNFQAVAETRTDRTGAVRAIEAERSRFQLRNGYLGMVRTSVHQAIGPRLFLVGIQN